MRSLTSEKRLFLLLRTPLGRKLLLGNFLRLRRAFLGRWSASGSADRYVRTAYRVVEGLQISAAKAARASLAVGPDLLGEEKTLETLRTFLVSQGVPEEAAQLQRLYLECANPALPVPALHGQELARPELLAQLEAEHKAAAKAASRAASEAPEPSAPSGTPTLFFYCV